MGGGMIWFFSLLAVLFLAGIAILFALDLPGRPGREEPGSAAFAASRSFGRGIMSLHPMVAAGGKQCLDDF